MIKNIEKYFYPITIQRRTGGTGSLGGPVDVFATHLTVDGVLRQLPSGAGEQHSSNKASEQSTHRMYCRIADIKVADRVYAGGNSYNIIAVNDVMGFGELLQVDCEKL